MQTLMLSQGFEPIDLKCWTEAMVDWANEKAEYVATYSERVVHAGRELYMPAIMRFTTPTRRRKHVVRFNRHNVYLRDEGRCQYCNTPVSKADMQYEHVVPRAQGGTTCWANIVVSCHACNQRKGGRTPAEAGMRLMQKPSRPRYLAGARREPPKLTVAAGTELRWHLDLPEDFRSALYWTADLEA